jgi:hypothetical protein
VDWTWYVWPRLSDETPNFLWGAIQVRWDMKWEWVLDFDWSINYQCLVEKFTLWEQLANIDVDNLKYYKDELNKCSLQEIKMLEKRFKTLLERLEQTNNPTLFVLEMQNACWNIINAKK